MSKHKQIKIIQKNIINCKRCNLYKTMPFGCTPVPGEGNINADLMLVGEALGENESKEGRPFVGASGKLLDKMLDECEINRESCYISNIVHCRPWKKPNKNRPPKQSEIDSCKIHIWKEMQIVQPRYIVTLGRIPTMVLLKLKSVKMKDVVGNDYSVDYIDATIKPNYHPSFLLQHGKSMLDKSKDVFLSIKKELS